MTININNKKIIHDNKSNYKYKAMMKIANQ